MILASIQDIWQNPQDISNFYLANIYQTLADPSRTNISDDLPAFPPPFSLPTNVVFINTLWFLSLVINLACALLAMLLQQYVRRYLKVTQPCYSLHNCAWICAIFSKGIEKLFLLWTAKILPVLLHISLFLFLISLVAFLWNVNLTIFKLILLSVSFCTALYVCVSVMPTIRHDSPYCTPVSFPVWYFAIGMKFSILVFLDMGLKALTCSGFCRNAHCYIVSWMHIFYPYFSVFYMDLFSEVFVFESLSLDMIRRLVMCCHHMHNQSHEVSCDVMWPWEGLAMFR